MPGRAWLLSLLGGLAFPVGGLASPPHPLFQTSLPSVKPGTFVTEGAAGFLKHAGAGFYLRGYMLQVQGKLDEVLAAYDQAIRFDPTKVQALTNRGVVRQNEGDIEGPSETSTRPFG